MAEAGKEVEVRVNVCRRRDGLYTVTMDKPGSSAKLTGCSWEEAQRLVLEAEPKNSGEGILRRLAQGAERIGSERHPTYGPLGIPEKA